MDPIPHFHDGIHAATLVEDPQCSRWHQDNENDKAAEIGQENTINARDSTRTMEKYGGLVISRPA